MKSKMPCCVVRKQTACLLGKFIHKLVTFRLSCYLPKDFVLACNRPPAQRAQQRHLSAAFQAQARVPARRQHDLGSRIDANDALIAGASAAVVAAAAVVLLLVVRVRRGAREHGVENVQMLLDLLDEALLDEGQFCGIVFVVVVVYVESATARHRSIRRHC